MLGNWRESLSYAQRWRCQCVQSEFDDVPGPFVAGRVMSLVMFRHQDKDVKLSFGSLNVLMPLGWHDCSRYSTELSTTWRVSERNFDSLSSCECRNESINVNSGASGAWLLTPELRKEEAVPIGE